jgi:O-antigen/teichoic acid export membrane protein
MTAEQMVEQPMLVQKSGRQLAVTILTQVLSWGFALLSTYILPKYRTLHEYAIFSIVFSVTALVGTICDSGLSSVISRTVTTDASRSRNLVLASFGVKASVTLAVFVVFNIFAWIVKYPQITTNYVSLAIVCSLAGQLASSIKEVIRGFGQVSRTNVIQLFERAMNAAIIVTLAVTHQPLHMFIWVPVLFDVIGIALSWRTYRNVYRVTTPSQTPLITDLKFVFSQFFLLASGAVFVHLKDPLVMLVLGYVATPAAIGGYSVAKRLLGSAMFVPVAFSQLGLPMLTSAYLRGKDSFHQQLQALLRAAFLVCIPVFLGFIFHGKQVLTLVGLYPKFVYGPVMLALSAPMMMLLYIAMMLTSAIVASGLQRKLVAGTIKVAILVPVVCVLLTVSTQKLLGNAGIGALASDVILEILLVVVYIRVLQMPIFTRELLGSIGRFAAMSIPLALAGMLSFGPIWGIATVLSIAFYGGILYKLGMLHGRILEAGE